MAGCVIKRCCCLTIKDGLEAFAYVKTIIIYTSLLYLTGGFYAQFQNTGVVEADLATLLSLCCLTTDFAFTVLHLYSLHKENLTLVKVYFYYMILTVVVSIVSLLVYFYRAVLSPVPSLAVFNIWVLIGTAVFAWSAIGLHVVLAIAVYSYGEVLAKSKTEALQTKTDIEMRRVSV